MTRIRRLGLVLFLLVATVGSDQATKAIARRALAERAPVSMLWDSVELAYTQNPGATLSLGAELSAEVRFLVFVVFVAVALAAMLGFVVTARQVTVYQIVGLSLVVGGGVGNLVDRITHGGAVVDFVRLRAGGLQTGIFNLADVAIFAGVGVFLVTSMTAREKKVEVS